MTSILYPLGKQAFGNAGINWGSDTIKAQLVALTGGTPYTYSAAHDNLDDVAAGARIGSPVTLGSKTNTLGVLDAADSTFTAVTGTTVGAIIIYKSTGVESTSTLIAYIDGVTAIPNGGDIISAWDNGASKIAVL